MTHDSRVSLLGRWGVGRKIACIPLFFVAAIAGLIAYAAIAANGQLDDMAVAQMIARQGMLNQWHMKELVLVSNEQASPKELQYIREVMLQTVDVLLRGGRVVRKL